MRIGFLFNHDQVHQVAHSLPVAIALAAIAPAAEIIVAVTTDALEAEVRRLAGGGLDRANVRFHRLTLRSPTRRLVSAALSGIAPTAKLLVYGDNLDFFRALDMLVVAEKTSLCLKTRYGLDRLRIVHTRHGAGDRAIGFGRESAAFDLVLVSGEKVRDRLIAEAGLAPDAIRIVGYPKFDIAAARPSPFDKAADTRPIVLYNPHPSPHLSSWYRTGRAVLEWFAAHPEYRLIFAPHVMLFHRRFVITIDKLRIDRAGRIGAHIFAAPNIHVDLGSPASTDMTYTNAADIYLGDASSQVYEFMVWPRPCVFLDAHGVDWRDDANFAHWSAGPVIRNVSALGEGLARARADHDARFAPAQRRLIARTFDLTDEPSALRAARAIAAFAGLESGDGAERHDMAGDAVPD